MNSFVRCMLLLILFIAAQRCIAANAPIRTEKEAQAIAEQAFLENTHHKIKEYSIHPGRHTSKLWIFVFMGEKQFLAPGNNWGVTVNRSTGATEFTEGM